MQDTLDKYNSASHLVNSSKKYSQFPFSPEPHRIREEVLKRYVFWYVGWKSIAVTKHGE